MSRIRFRQHLSAPGLLRIVRDGFDRIEDPIASLGQGLTDCRMSAQARFRLKYPSLLRFEPDARDEDRIRSNLENGYGVVRAPSESALRERRDPVDPRSVRRAFRKVFAAGQRGKGLAGFTGLGHPLLSVDGTGVFSSKTVHCDHCGEQHHRNGSTTGIHPMRGAVRVHPEHREGFPLAPEPIRRADGSRKNDGERQAAKRLRRDGRREHPHLKRRVVVDALASNGAPIRLLEELDRRDVLGVKPGDPGERFYRACVWAATRTVERKKGGSRFRFRFLNGVPLNPANPDLEGNFLACQEVRPNGCPSTPPDLAAGTECVKGRFFRSSSGPPPIRKFAGGTVLSAGFPRMSLHPEIPPNPRGNILGGNCCTMFRHC